MCWAGTGGFMSLGAATVSVHDAELRYLAARLPSGQSLDDFRAVAIDPRTRDISKVGSDVLDDDLIAALPACVAARATAQSDGFQLTLQFALDHETGAYFWEIWDDHWQSPVASDEGVTSGRGIRPWRRAIGRLKEHARDYATSLELVGTLERELAIDAPDELESAVSSYVARPRS